MSFTKNDLRSGDVVETRSGDKFLVLSDAQWPHYFRGVKINGVPRWIDLLDYAEDMTCESTRDLDIMKVWRVECPDDQPWNMSTDDMELIFEREDIREMTMSELKRFLGFTVKIVEG